MLRTAALITAALLQGGCVASIIDVTYCRDDAKGWVNDGGTHELPTRENVHKRDGRLHMRLVYRNGDKLEVSCKLNEDGTVDRGDVIVAGRVPRDGEFYYLPERAWLNRADWRERTERLRPVGDEFSPTRWVNHRPGHPTQQCSETISHRDPGKTLMACVSPTGFRTYHVNGHGFALTIEELPEGVVAPDWIEGQAAPPPDGKLHLAPPPRSG